VCAAGSFSLKVASVRLPILTVSLRILSSSGFGASRLVALLSSSCGESPQCCVRSVRSDRNLVILLDALSVACRLFRCHHLMCSVCCIDELLAVPGRFFQRPGWIHQLQAVRSHTLALLFCLFAAAVIIVLCRCRPLVLNLAAPASPLVCLKLLRPPSWVAFSSLLVALNARCPRGRAQSNTGAAQCADCGTACDGALSAYSIIPFPFLIRPDPLCWRDV
jgi:hypothetical protein